MLPWKRLWCRYFQLWLSLMPLLPTFPHVLIVLVWFYAFNLMWLDGCCVNDLVAGLAE